MDAAWELGITTFDTADAYGGGRSETWIGEWLADEGLGSSRRDHDRDEDVQPDGRGRGSRAVRPADPAADRVEPRAARHRAHTAVHGARARSGHAARGDARDVRRARAGRDGRRGRRVQLHGRPARGSRRDLRARRARRATSGCRTRSRSSSGTTPTPYFPVCREHGLGYEAHGPIAGGWLAGPLPARRRRTRKARG